ncbi:MAG: superoxide dismutase [Candidatus Saccharimonadales bacterium]
MMFTLPNLGYDYDSLGDYISKDIMQLHHDKHHQTYVDKLNAAVEGHTDLAGKEVSELLTQLDSLPEDIRTAVRNHGGGHFNHSLFWQWMSPQGGGQPGGELEKAIIEKYGDFQTFIDQFNTKALGVFGSGWVWLQSDLEIITSPNQDSPLLTGQPAPLLGLDVWEHAYYLDYKNKRDDYVNAWWNVVNWDFVAQRFNDK